ncbi:hypothetical protein HYALB_00002306 [Hymenoscyphus albidus]|uniref:Cystathionine gamma-synthase n=1 Tax=Hymenoscyphus albidus TaxID=595503 RepID=A0A9N9M1K9_9HELO|nr:hypothetical protein HYALB_00002306 [Hymenoscyphus albidus]
MPPATSLITTKPGEAVLPAEKHSITFHLPEWSHLLRLAEKDPFLFSELKSVYPRVIIHPDVKLLFKAILEFAKVPEGSGSLVFTSPRSINMCIDFATRSPPVALNEAPAESISSAEIDHRVFEIQDTKTKLHAIIFPSSKTSLLLPFWQNTGTGISTRLAAQSLSHIDSISELAPQNYPPKSFASGAHIEIKDRMTSVFQVHRYLNWPNHSSQKTVLFGSAFQATIHIFEDFGPGYKLLGRGTDDELEAVEEFLKYEKEEGRHVQAIWCEFPTNPNLTVPNLFKLRQLADVYGCLLIVDDTIGSFCNVDLFGPSGVDILVTSLTKSFSRIANVMGGSAVLNPLRPRYETLKELFNRLYENDVCSLDSEALAKNSRTYLSTSQTCQIITENLISFLVGKANSPTSAIKSVFYPTTNPEPLANFDPWKRPDTPEFKTGYGCLFSLEFESIEKMRVFYETVQVHIGPHFGAMRTLMFAYVKRLYSSRLDWIGDFWLKETMLRIAPGLEENLMEVFREAVDIMDGIAGAA